MKKTKVLPPRAAKTMTSMSASGYDLRASIGDIVDNSVQAKADTVWIELVASVEDKPLVYVWDNGAGMNSEALERAMTYGADGSQGIGRFGLGLKTASLAISDSLDVVSRPTARAPLAWGNWDTDRVKKSDSWEYAYGEPNENHVEIFDEHLKGSRGTAVMWEKIGSLGKGSFSEQSRGQHERRLREYLSLTYHRMIESGQVKIYLNEILVEAWNPFCPNEPETEVGLHHDLLIEMDGKEYSLELKCYFIPHNSAFSSSDAEKAAKVGTKYQGFFLYREDRVIKSGDWLGLQTKDNHLNMCRFLLDVDRDLDVKIGLTFTKSETKGMRDELFKEIEKIVKPQIQLGNRKYREITKTEKKSKSKINHQVGARQIRRDYEKTDAKAIEVRPVVGNRGEQEKETTKGPIRIKLRSEPKQEFHCAAVGKLKSGALYEPFLLQGNQVGVRLNQDHPFYQNIFLEMGENSAATKGIEFLLWTLALAEMSPDMAWTNEQMEEFRGLISRNLRSLADDPDL